MSIDFSVQTNGTIAGRVLDQNNEPVPDAWIVLVAREYSLGAIRYVYASTAQVNDEGEYLLQRVTPGRAFLLMAARRTLKLDPISEAPADPQLRRPAYVPTYYPGVAEIEGAQPLTLRMGEHRDGIDFRLRRGPAYCIEGTIQAAGGPTAIRFQIGAARPTSGRSGSGGFYAASPNGTVGPDGRIRLCDLPPGDYQLTVNSAFSTDMPAFFGITPVAITDRDVRNVTVTPRPAVSIPGEVLWDGPPPDAPAPESVQIRLVPLTRAIFLGEGQPARATIPGMFSFARVLVDEYDVRVTGVPADAYIKDILYAGRSLRTEPLRAGTAIGNASLKIILARDGATLSAKVADREGNPVADSHVVLLPASAASEAALADTMILGQTDQNGAWTSARLAPGKYYALARRTAPDKSPESIGCSPLAF
ncbi:MAG: hypothetical protein ACK5AZ_12885 [Bryobacteraceae bacterium]